MFPLRHRVTQRLCLCSECSFTFRIPAASSLTLTLRLTPLTCVSSIIWERGGQAEQVHPGRALQRPGVEAAQLSCGCWARSIHQAPRSRGRRSSGSEPVVILRGWLCHLGFWDGPAGQPAPPLPPPHGQSFPLRFCPCLSPVQVGRQRARVLAPGPVSESAIEASPGVSRGGREVKGKRSFSEHSGRTELWFHTV